MSATATYEEPATELPMDEDALEYRALHTGAIISLVLGCVSISTLLTAANSLETCLMVAPIPLVGIFLALRSWTQISREPELYTGKLLAQLGLLLSAFFLITGVSHGLYVYATEVPPGYTRISFNGMKPDTLDERNGLFTPDEIQQLDGTKVFIKGYIRPDSLKVRKNAKSFLFVRDNNQCCFGDLAKIKYYDQMKVDMQGDLSVDYSSGLFRMGGTLRTHPHNLARGPGAPVFSLEADYVN